MVQNRPVKPQEVSGLCSPGEAQEQMRFLRLGWGHIMGSGRVENLKSPSHFKLALLVEAGYPSASEKTNLL